MSLPVQSNSLLRFPPYQKVLDLHTGEETNNIQATMDGDIEAKLRGKVRVKGVKDDDD